MKKKIIISSYNLSTEYVNFIKSLVPYYFDINIINEYFTNIKLDDDIFGILYGSKTNENEEWIKFIHYLEPDIPHYIFSDNLFHFLIDLMK